MVIYEWHSPWPVLTKEGEETYCDVKSQIQEKDVADFMRKYYNDTGIDCSQSTDQDLIDDFRAVYWTERKEVE